MRPISFNPFQLVLVAAGTGFKPPAYAAANPDLRMTHSIKAVFLAADDPPGVVQPDVAAGFPGEGAECAVDR